MNVSIQTYIIDFTFMRSKKRGNRLGLEPLYFLAGRPKIFHRHHSASCKWQTYLHTPSPSDRAAGTTRDLRHAQRCKCPHNTPVSIWATNTCVKSCGQFHGKWSNKLRKNNEYAWHTVCGQIYHPTCCVQVKMNSVTLYQYL